MIIFTAAPAITYIFLSLLLFRNDYRDSGHWSGVVVAIGKTTLNLIEYPARQTTHLRIINKPIIMSIQY